MVENEDIVEPEKEAEVTEAGFADKLKQAKENAAEFLGARMEQMGNFIERLKGLADQGLDKVIEQKARIIPMIHASKKLLRVLEQEGKINRATRMAVEHYLDRLEEMLARSKTRDDLKKVLAEQPEIEAGKKIAKEKLGKKLLGAINKNAEQPA